MNAFNSGYSFGLKERDSEWSAFWERFQRGGTNPLPNSVFSGDRWDNTTCRPMYPITLSRQMFKSSRIENLDHLQLIGAHSLFGVFQGCNQLTHLPAILATNLTTVSDNWHHLFSSCTRLARIELLDIWKDAVLFHTFWDCQSLQYLRLSAESEIGNSIDFSHSSKLTADTVYDVIQHLSHYDPAEMETPKICSFHEEAWSRFESAYPAADYIAYSAWGEYLMNIGWSLSHAVVSSDEDETV